MACKGKLSVERIVREQQTAHLGLCFGGAAKLHPVTKIIAGLAVVTKIRATVFFLRPPKRRPVRRHSWNLLIHRSQRVRRGLGEQQFQHSPYIVVYEALSDLRDLIT